MVDSAQRHLLFVVGMHRSGTSAVCAALDACGVEFGEALLGPVARINARGFWEAQSVVELNEELLQRAGTSWYSLTTTPSVCDFSSSQYDDCRARARELLQAGFGAGPVEAVKDPRLCLTLQFWLQACNDVGLAHSACVVRRHPFAVARSLEIRDNFPLGFGLRLVALYERLASCALPEGSYQLSYEHLLQSPADVLGPFLDTLPLKLDEEALRAAVDVSLRHHHVKAAPDAGGLEWAGIGGEDFDTEIDLRYPLLDTLSVLADRFVDRGKDLTRMGQLHSQALTVIASRDGELAQAQGDAQRVGGMHSVALATIAEKDRLMAENSTLHIEALAAIAEKDKLMAESSVLHSKALATIAEKDIQAAELSGLYEEACDNTRSLEERLSDMGAMHSRALAVIDERDAQIREFDRRLADLGAQHRLALQHLEYLSGLPLLGPLVQILLHRAQR